MAGSGDLGKSLGGIVGKQLGSRVLCVDLDVPQRGKKEHPHPHENVRSRGMIPLLRVACVKLPRAKGPSMYHCFLLLSNSLSAWRFSQTWLKSTRVAIRVRPWHSTSAVRELPLVQVCGERATSTRCPCTSNVLEVIRGRLKLLNSLHDIERDRGHACFWASMESRMQVTSHSPSVVAPSLERDLDAQ